MIKQTLINNAKAVNLVDLIKSKGIEVKKRGGQYMALCPFHHDHHPSLAIDTKTNLFKCFGCGASGDAIRFIELFEQKGFPAAVEALTGEFADHQQRAEMEQPSKEQELLNRVAAFYHETFCAKTAPREYLVRRGIDKPEIYQAFRLGYADGGLSATLPQAGPVFDTLRDLGILTKTGKELFLDCVTFPLFDSNGNVTGFYGRKINDQEKIHHLYLPGKRRGLVNRQAATTGAELILTESIIDALTLYQNGFPNVIPLYGTNGLTTDHLELFHAYRPKKLHLCLNNDEPGRMAAARIAEELTSMGFNSRVLNLTEAKDVNDFFCAGRTRADFDRLLAEETVETRPGYRAVEANLGLVVTCQDRQYRIRGISLHSLERLRVNVRATCGEKYHIDTLDLYQSKARRYFTAQLAKIFGLEPALLDEDLLFLINQIEAYQAKELAKKEEPEKKKYQMTKKEEEEALGILKDPNLVELILSDMETLGHVGEETGKILVYLIAVSRRLTRPLSGIIISGSGAGKSGLVETIQELTPPEEVEFFSRITPQALYYMERDALKRKLLIIEERTGGEGADYSIRTLQSRQKLTQAVPIKDPNSGKIKTMTFEVEGPIAYLETTTSAEINHENATRCFEIYLDESVEQTRRIHQAQRKAKTGAGLVKKTTAEAIKTRHHNLQRMLKEVAVEIPYAMELDFPADSLRTRRDHERFLSLIEAVTFLFQHQRKQKEIITPEGEKAPCVLSEVEDYARAYALAKEILGFTLDDLKKHARELLELITAMVKKLSEARKESPKELSFTRHQIREYTGWPDHQIKAHIKQLEEMEYLIIDQIRSRGQFGYLLNNPQERKPLKGLLLPEELIERLSRKQHR
jgi:DNA primase catalytic core